ncbi:gametogenetin isoform X1 [Mus musculus]|uniref:Gametogenetin n=1 Tax=Mus musculus TaxID=10090 RepID=A0A140LI02_MOUSE|nr:gametogenetin isoform X1 [Mus musculus]|eukprot:XP_006540007.1 PREDICTED: gametogenetin isoform X1 [Mus musculus]
MIDTERRPRPSSKMGNVQSEPSAGGGSRKEQASDRASDSRRTPLVEPEVTPSSPAMRLARGLGVWFPGSSGPPGLLIPPEPQASSSPLPLTLELPSPVTPPPEEAAAVSTPPPPPVGTLLPAPSKWRKPTGTSVPRIRGLLEASHRGQGDPPSLRPLPPLPRQLTEKDPVLRAPAPPPTPLEPRKQLPPAPSTCDPQPLSRRITLASSATSPTESQVRHSSEGQAAGGAHGGVPPQAGEGEMARSATSESGLSLLCKVTFKSGPHLSPTSASGPLAAKASPGAGGGGLFASSGAISYAEVLKQGPQPPGATRPLGEVPPGATRPLGEVPRAAQETEGGDGDGEGCSGPPSVPAPLARALPPPPYTTFPGSKPKFDWVSPPDGTERHFRFNGAVGGIGAPRRRTTTLSGPWGSPPPRSGQTHPSSGPRRPTPALLAPPMFIFPAPNNGEPVRPVPPSPQQIPPLPPPPPTPPATPPPAPPPTPQPPALPRTPILVARPPTPGPGHLESALAPTPPSTLSPTAAADQVPAATPATVTSQVPATATAELSPPMPQPKTRTRRNKGPRAARGVIREEGTSGDGPREPNTAPVTDSSSGGGGGGSNGTSTAGASNKGTARHWPPFEVLNSCPCKCYCRHQRRHRRLPRNVSAWLSTPTNHLSEPPWVATVKLAGSLVAGLEHYDLQATHST